MEKKFKYYLYNDRKRSFLEIENHTVCGRVEGDLQFAGDKLVSRKHCQFTIVGNEIYIEDFSSTNRTRVNTVPIQSGRKRRIRLHDVIEFGSQRFVLTNQNRFEPANTQDALKERPVYKARKKADGSLTGYITGLITKATLVRVDRASFEKLRIRKKLKPIRRNSSTLSVSLLLALFWVIVGYQVKADGAFAPGLQHNPERLFDKFILIAVLSTLIAAFVHKILVAKSSGRLMRRFVSAALLAVIGSGAFYGARELSLISDIRDNIVEFDCRRDSSQERCQRSPARLATSPQRIK